MSEFEDIQSLIRLKRHEQPPEGFVEDFLADFHQRQRADLLQRSARSLLWERVTTYFADLMSPKWAWAGATAAAVIALSFTLRGHSTSGLQVAEAPGQEETFEVSSFAASDPGAFKANVENYLKAVEFEPEGAAGSQDLLKPRLIPQAQSGMMVPAGLSIQP